MGLSRLEQGCWFEINPGHTWGYLRADNGGMNEEGCVDEGLGNDMSHL